MYLLDLESLCIYINKSPIKKEVTRIMLVSFLILINLFCVVIRVKPDMAEELNRQRLLLQYFPHLTRVSRVFGMFGGIKYKIKEGINNM